MALLKKGLGRGLSALIPDDDMEFLSRVARGETLLAPETSDQTSHDTAFHEADPRINPQVRETQLITGSNGKKRPIKADSAPDASVSDINEGLTANKEVEPATPKTTKSSIVEWIDTSAIEANPFQPRRTFSEVEMQELVDSVRDHGILQPILVRPLPAVDGRDRFQLVAGERRWRAASAAGLARVPAVIREVADQQALELALIENVQRHDISAVDAAIAYRRLATEFSLSQEDIARRVGKSRSAVANTIRLLDLPAEAQKAIENGELSEGHGRAILLAATDGARRAVFRRIIRDKLSVRQAEEAARQATEGEGEGGNKSAPKITEQALSLELRELEAELQRVLSTRLKIKPKAPPAKGGQIVIEYFTDQDVNRLLSLFRNSKP
ncbi:MAG: ParB/RepB/Spo0J family partition protein [Abitibacteriaceae bacterium]|nr:ParB/RepB/Spo0J family partition protein [Abditibacteriaceae bacterium]MBV9867208.1 ParB/RepB/Spo0J family partition protein [Abditibacteriaceae bacterium]